ncbi:MAG: hypothetical protein HC796_07870 [Synechococcaceae cyanobacterium RL_1_2]|nr:hypothetical protein [Synechococcaceae cyanobacterium RL_1_2]
MLHHRFWSKTLTASAIAIAATIGIHHQSASAQAAYGSYIGIGPTFGLTDNLNGQGQQIGGVIAMRYKFLEAPFSIRTQALIGQGTAVIPTISYDFPISWQSDLYLGLGASFASEGPSPVGDQTAFAIQPGIDYMVPNSNLAIFGNAVVAFDAYRDSGGTAFSVQTGVGLRF